MVFLLMTIIGIFFIFKAFLTLFFTLFKKGKFLRKKLIFISLSLVTLVEFYITISALPTNFIVKKVTLEFLMILLFFNLFLYLVRCKKSFNSRRLILGILSTISTIALFTF
ncbi:putative membrane protein [[Clostridium] bifermentans ATCC 638]|uniref:Putative membrane protein n=1 Tax=Paraclostridium bifermentans ATCC 638 = DSM 14991 TaxID=1233171 RepID=T4V964_PARBF|nr:putative membrane protein [[Clostridium] bifermentans ATCC 638] [Paraclostridium bifermentans ATCC 638 = DSM 14991]RIZ57691.1 hypothetical protein CHH45_15260 [Paraclostridium bifermentans]